MKVAFDFKMVMLLTHIVFTVFISSVSIVIAQETEIESSEATSDQEVITLEGMVVVGTRAKPRSVLESAVPIDVLPSEDFVRQGGTDLPDLLRNLVPSYNVNAQPIADAATVVRPANLRGLAPDHTLLLVNGKRRHRASVIAWLGNGVSDGAQGADLSPIPSIALKQVEVLRDGASAQYGSDAIAGVMNLQLKDSYKGGSFEIKPGIFQAGDGLTYILTGNIGLGREDLWTNLSVEYGGMNETDRSIQRDDAAALIDAGNTDVADPAQPWGHPIIRNDIKLFANYGASMTDNIKFYGHANYAQKEVEGGFYFRNPNTRGAVFSNDGGKTLLVGNLRGLTAEMAEWEARKSAAETAGQEFTELSPHAADDIPITNNVPDPVALQQVFSDPNLFTFQELFPGGFTPRFGADTQDASLLIGLKGTVAEDLGWDLSASYGRHASDFFIRNTVNASLGPDTPTEFDPGNYIQADTNINFDLTYPLHDMVFLASGLEYRTETFEILQGQTESWKSVRWRAKDLVRVPMDSPVSVILPKGIGRGLISLAIWKVNCDSSIFGRLMRLSGVNTLTILVAQSTTKSQRIMALPARLKSCFRLIQLLIGERVAVTVPVSEHRHRGSKMPLTSRQNLVRIIHSSIKGQFLRHMVPHVWWEGRYLNRKNRRISRLER